MGKYFERLYPDADLKLESELKNLMVSSLWSRYTLLSDKGTPPEKASHDVISFGLYLSRFCGDTIDVF